MPTQVSLQPFLLCKLCCALAICSRVLKIVTPSETSGKVVFSVSQVGMMFVSFLAIPVGAQKRCGQNMQCACLEDSAIMGGQVGGVMLSFLS